MEKVGGYLALLALEEDEQAFHRVVQIMIAEGEWETHRKKMGGTPNV